MIAYKAIAFSDYATASEPLEGLEPSFSTQVLFPLYCPSGTTCFLE